MKYYKISEKALETLLESFYTLQALEQGGVDDWEWYGLSIRDYCNQFNQTINKENPNEDIDMDKLVKYAKHNYYTEIEN